MQKNKFTKNTSSYIKKKFLIPNFYSYINSFLKVHQNSDAFVIKMFNRRVS